MSTDTTKPETFSISKLGAYESCPKQFSYKYIEKEKSAFDSIEAFMGSRVHDTVEWLYQARLAGGRPTLKAAVDFYEARWLQCYQQNPVPVRVVRQDGSTQGDYAQQGKLMLRNFYPRFIDDEDTTVAIEHKIEAKIGTSDHVLVGYIDRLVEQKNGVLEIIDYKTGKNTPDEFIGKEANQLRAYAYGYMQQNPEVGLIDLRLVFLRSGEDRTGVFRREDMASVARQLLSRIAATKVDTAYIPRPSALCAWCGFNDRCEGPTKKAKGGSAPLPF